MMNRTWIAVKSAVALFALAVALTACTTTTPVNQNGIGIASSKPTSPPPYSFPETRVATGNNVVIFDPKKYAWAAYDSNGQLVRDGIASGGRDYCSDIASPCHTPSGTYRVYRKGTADCESSIFPLGKGGAPMPYCMFFKGGFALHGSYDVPYGENASHGCVRLLPTDAAWLSQSFVHVGTTVIVEHY